MTPTSFPDHDVVTSFYIQAMWQLLENAKVNADALCRLHAIEDYITPFLEMDDNKDRDAFTKVFCRQRIISSSIAMYLCVNSIDGMIQ